MVSEKDREDTQTHSHRETQGHRQRQREHAESNRKSSVSGRESHRESQHFAEKELRDVRNTEGQEGS